MKHLLIIFSILLPSSTLFGQETGVLYQYEASSGIKWGTFGNVKVQPMYKGEIKNGVPNGQGLYSYPDGRKYFGQWKDGKINGRGSYTSPFRWKYVGQFKDGKSHGQGKCTYPDGERYVGEFKDGIDWNTKWHNLNGEIAGEYVNGILIK